MLFLERKFETNYYSFTLIKQIYLVLFCASIRQITEIKTYNFCYENVLITGVSHYLVEFTFKI